MIDRLLDRLTGLCEKMIRGIFKTPPAFVNTREKTAEIVNYLLFGALTTLVSLITYFAAAKVLRNSSFSGAELQGRANICQIFSWICAVLFAFFTNKRWVFRSDKKSTGALAEFGRFVLARVISFLVIELGIFDLMLLLLRTDSVCKLIVTVLVIVFNYFASKLAVFRTGRPDGSDRGDAA